MNQAIHFPDRERWDEHQQAVCFPVLVQGMQLTCAIHGETLLHRFGGTDPLAVFCENPRTAGRRSGLGLVILIQIVILPFYVVVRRVF